jgi:hypothetical protein
VAARNKVDRVAREVEAQIQSEEVRFRECTLAAKNQAQVAVAQAQERAQATETEEARNRIRLNLLRFEVQAAREEDMAQLEDEEVGDVGLMGSLDNDGTN